jgi:hypothetical protein
VVNHSLLVKYRELVASPVESVVPDPARPNYQRLAIPHSFKPQLSLHEAVLAASGALLRILFGSLLFAVWGTYTFLVWSTVKNLALRGVLLLGMFALFAVSMALLMVAISSLLRMIWPHRQERS